MEYLFHSCIDLVVAAERLDQLLVLSLDLQHRVERLGLLLDGSLELFFLLLELLVVELLPVELLFDLDDVVVQIGRLLDGRVFLAF